MHTAITVVSINDHDYQRELVHLYQLSYSSCEAIRGKKAEQCDVNSISLLNNKIGILPVTLLTTYGALVEVLSGRQLLYLLTPVLMSLTICYLILSHMFTHNLPLSWSVAVN